MSVSPVALDVRARIRAMRHSDGLTLQAIADTLNGEGVPTLRGGATWRRSTVRLVIVNPDPPPRRSKPQRVIARRRPPRPEPQRRRPPPGPLYPLLDTWPRAVAPGTYVEPATGVIRIHRGRRRLELTPAECRRLASAAGPEAAAVLREAAAETERQLAGLPAFDPSRPGSVGPRL